MSHLRPGAPYRTPRSEPGSPAWRYQITPNFSPFDELQPRPSLRPPASGHGGPTATAEARDPELDLTEHGHLHQNRHLKKVIAVVPGLTAAVRRSSGGRAHLG